MTCVFHSTFTHTKEASMQIVHLSQTVYTFIDNQLPPALGRQCYMAFYLAEQLGLKEYDQTFKDLIEIDGAVEMDTIRDIFVEKVGRLMIECIAEHRIQIDPDASATMDELIEVLHFLELVQRLEDPETISMRLNGLGTPKKVFIDLLAKLSHLEEWRCMELIESVDEKLIEAMRQLTHDTMSVQAQAPDEMYQLGVQALEQFVSDNECLGVTMYSSGYTRLEWSTLTALIPLDLNKHFHELSTVSLAQCALDLVSLALICKDTYQTPLLHLQKVMPVYIEDPHTVTKVNTAVLAILSDYQAVKETLTQQKKFNQGNQS